MKNWTIYLLLLAFVCLLGAKAVADSRSVDRKVITPQVVMSAFSTVAFPSDACEQSSSIDATGHVNVSYSLNIKDYHNYIDDPFTRNRKIELQGVFYLFYHQAWLSSCDLSSLQRLNV